MGRQRLEVEKERDLMAAWANLYLPRTTIHDSTLESLESACV